jgi:hypothetical protein
MIMSSPLWLIGVGFALESTRRGFIGGSSLALFVIKEFGLDRQAVPTLNLLRGYLELEEKLLADLPPYLEFLLAPFTDYHEAAKTFLRIIDILSEAQRPRTCEYYWKKGEEA